MRDQIFQIHYVDSRGQQLYDGPHYGLRQAEVAARTVEGAGGKNVTVVRLTPDCVPLEDAEW
jgi:hypothetical protein